MSTRNEILNGALFEGWEDFCHEIANAILQHYRVADPCTNMTNRNPGEILSDPNNDKIHHVGGASGYPCDEIIQETRSQDAIPILTSVELGHNQITTDTMARAYLNNNQLNIPNTTWTKVLLDAENFDPGNNFDLVNNKFVTPVAGYYDIIGAVYWTDVTADKRYFGGIYVNGTLVASDNRHASHVQTLSCIPMTHEYIDAGVDVELYCYHDAGAATPDVVNGRALTYLAVKLYSL